MICEQSITDKFGVDGSGGDTPSSFYLSPFLVDTRLHVNIHFGWAWCTLPLYIFHVPIFLRHHTLHIYHVRILVTALFVLLLLSCVWYLLARPTLPLILWAGPAFVVLAFGPTNFIFACFVYFHRF